jgi:hypothetical protein
MPDRQSILRGPRSCFHSCCSYKCSCCKLEIRLRGVGDSHQSRVEYCRCYSGSSRYATYCQLYTRSAIDNPKAEGLDLYQARMLCPLPISTIKHEIRLKSVMGGVHQTNLSTALARICHIVRVKRRVRVCEGRLHLVPRSCDLMWLVLEILVQFLNGPFKYLRSPIFMRACQVSK